MLQRFIHASRLAAAILITACASSPGAGAPTDAAVDSAPQADVALTPDVATAPDVAATTDVATTADAGGGSALTGTLGTLGAVQPIVSAWVIANSGETLVYLSTAPLTCETLQTSRWLGTQPAGSQVVELVMRGTPSSGQTVAVPPGEVNYAAGGRSSSYEVGAAAGSITFTTASAGGPVEGTVRSTYRNGGMVMGTFHAEFCDHGQGY